MANQYRVKTGVKLYTQVLEQVKSMIAQGVYKKGDLLPSEKELIEMMGVSRITVRKALQSSARQVSSRPARARAALWQWMPVSWPPPAWT